MKLYADDSRLKFPAFNHEQEKFVFNRFPFVCGSGGYGSGKTTALVCRAILLSVDSEWFGDCSGVEGLLGRQKALDFKKTTLRDFFSWLPPAWLKQYWDKDGKIELVNGSLIHLTHLDSMEHLQSYNLVWAGIDQMEQVSEDVFKCLAFERIRNMKYRRYYPKSQGGGAIVPEFVVGKDGEPVCVSTKPEELNAVVQYHTVFGVCNPRPCWIEEKFYQNEIYKDSPDEYVRAKYNPSFKYIHIPTRENVANQPANYIEQQFINKSSREFARDVEGSWEAWEGKVYLGCTRSVLLTYNIVPHPSWDIYVGIDHGGTGDDKTKRTGVKAAVFIAYQHRAGQYPLVYIFDELYCQSTTIEEFIAEIDNKLKRIYLAQTEYYPNVMDFISDGRVKVKAWRCDPSMSKLMPESTNTIKDKYMYFARMRGIKMSLVPGDNDVIKGVGYIDWMMRKGIMRISPKCSNAYTEFSSLEYAENEKIKPLQRDHLENATRYAVSAFPREFDMNIRLKKKKSLFEMEMERHRKQNEQVAVGYYGL